LNEFGFINENNMHRKGDRFLYPKSLWPSFLVSLSLIIAELKMSQIL